MSRDNPTHQNVSDLPKLAAPAQRALSSARITTLEQLTELTEAELLQLHGMGMNALGKLREALAERGLSFHDTKKKRGIDKTIRTQLDNIRSEDGQLQNKAYFFLMEKTEIPVDWAYEAWDELVEGLTHMDNHVRAISAQALANLGKSDPKGRMFKDFDKLLNVTKDERFVTARHCLQNIWKVGLGGKNAQQLVVNGLEKRFHECITEKNCTLIRYDIIVGLRNLYDATISSEIKEKALELIETEKDVKYRKKYATVWRK
jgi:HEAT repeat protein